MNLSGAHVGDLDHSSDRTCWEDYLYNKLNWSEISSHIFKSQENERFILKIILDV